MRQIPFRWWLVFLALIAATNFAAYKYGKTSVSDTNTSQNPAKEATSSDDEDIIIIVARPEKKSQGDTLDEQLFRIHIVSKETPWLCVGKGNLLKYRGHMFSRKPLQEGQQMLIPFFQ